MLFILITIHLSLKLTVRQAWKKLLKQVVLQLTPKRYLLLTLTLRVVLACGMTWLSGRLKASWTMQCAQTPLTLSAA